VVERQAEKRPRSSYWYLGSAGGLPPIEGLQEYQKAAKSYSRKILTFSNDVLNAFEGVYNRFKGDGSDGELTNQQTQDIPVSYLYCAFLWSLRTMRRSDCTRGSRKIRQQSSCYLGPGN
jgi:hypothetical protein